MKTLVSDLEMAAALFVVREIADVAAQEYRYSGTSPTKTNISLANLQNLVFPIGK